MGVDKLVTRKAQISVLITTGINHLPLMCSRSFELVLGVGGVSTGKFRGEEERQRQELVVRQGVRQGMRDDIAANSAAKELVPITSIFFGGSRPRRKDRVSPLSSG